MKKSTNLKLKPAMLLLLTLGFAAPSAGQEVLIPAFPGAEGAAKYTPGGRGGDVYHVTHTRPSGEGSLVHGIKSADGPRTIVFDTGGIIELEEALEIRNVSRLTIAGQTAPGYGITLRFNQGGLYITNSEDIIVTNLRIAKGSDENGRDALRTNGSGNVLLSHLTVRWAGRGNVVSRPAGPLTAQYMINAEPTGRNLAGWFGQMRQEEGLYNITVRKNLGIHQGGRLNMFQSGRFEFMNNVTFNGSSRRPDLGPYYIMSRPWHGTHESDLGPQIFDANVIGNVMIDGENPPEATFGFGRASRVFIDGNMRDRLPDEPFSPEPADEDIFEGEVERGGHRGDEFARVQLPLDLRMMEAQHTQPVSARQAYIHVLSYSGASASRDGHDHRYVRDVMNKQVRNLPETLTELDEEPFPAYDPGTPQHSTAGDGIPDKWKRERNLDPETAYHRHYTNEGYTYLEKYLHWLMRHHLPPDALETQEILVTPDDGNGSHATVASEAWDRGAGQSGSGTITVEKTDAVRQAGLLRFDLSKVEPGMMNDATLEMALSDVDGETDDLKIRVFGLDHDRQGQTWPSGPISGGDAPALEAAGNSLQLIRDDVILIGDLKINDGIAKLTNPNLAVFLNLARHYAGNDHSELVTLVLVPVTSGNATFHSSDAAGNGFAPRLQLDAVPSRN